MQIQLYQLLQICPDNLVSVDEYDLLEVHREQNVEKQDFVCPNDALLFLLSTQPRGPLVCD